MAVLCCTWSQLAGGREVVGVSVSDDEMGISVGDDVTSFAGLFTSGSVGFGGRVAVTTVCGTFVGAIVGKEIVSLQTSHDLEFILVLPELSVPSAMVS